MTLTKCIIANDGIVIASDSKASYYLTSNDTAKKIFKLHDHFAVGLAGDGPLAIFLLEVIKPDLDFDNGIIKLAEQLSEKLKERFDFYFANVNPEKITGLDILLAGYTDNSKPMIIQLSSEDNFAPRISPTGFECIGVPVIANYILNRLYEPEITSEHAAELATFCIKETSSQDSSVGGPVQIARFSNTSAYLELTKEAIKSIEDKCDKFRSVHKSNFYPEDETTGTTTPSPETQNE